MAEILCEIQRVEEIAPFPDPSKTRLEMARVLGWWVMVRKGLYQVGDLCLYLQPDSVLTPQLEELWLSGSKFKLEKGRIKALKFGPVISQGLILTVEQVEEAYRLKGVLRPVLSQGRHVGRDLGITKFEPPPPAAPRGRKEGKPTPKHPDFKEYTDINHLRNNPTAIQEGELVVVMEKIHGTNHRQGVLDWHPRTFLQRLAHRFLRWTGLFPKSQNCLGTRRVEITARPAGYKGFYDDNTFREKVAQRYWDRLKPGEELFGEIFGPGIQKGFHYGVQPGEVGFVAFDVMVNGRYLDSEELIKWCVEREIPMAPVLYIGPFSLEMVERLCQGPSVLYPSQEVREGVVVRPIKERHTMRGRAIFKAINPAYYLLNTTEYH